jgi:UrcA family protein
MNTQQKKTNHKKTALKIYAAPLVMLVLASALATPAASAEGKLHGYRTVQATFHYDADAPAEQIYGKLRKLADRMCVTKGPRPLWLRQADEACIASAMKDGVSRIGRTDIAALHSRNAG